MDISNIRLNPVTAEQTFIRTARKNHFCSGGHDGERNTRCDKPIEAGSTYIEYVGESTPFHSGHRYHLNCAQEQGLITLCGSTEPSR